VAYRDNVQKLCDRLGLINPIHEEDLTIAKVTFVTSQTTYEVPGTHMNRAGRLFLQSHADGALGIQMRPLRAEAEQFFTPTLWDDCSPEHRGLIHGIKTSDLALLTYK
jgi:hypothetical protein